MRIKKKGGECYAYTENNINVIMDVTKVVNSHSLSMKTSYLCYIRINSFQYMLFFVPFLKK